MSKLIILNILLAILSILSSILIVRAVKRNKALEKVNEGLKKNLQKAGKAANKRKQKEETLRIEDGSQEKASLFYRIDVSLAQSGLTKKFPFLSTELFLGIVIVSIAATFMAGIQYSMFAGMTAAFLAGFVYYAIVYLLMAANYKRTEKQIVNFVDMLKNYSRTSDDILTIFKNVSLYLEEPLKSAVNECCAEAAATGDLSAAMIRMSIKVEHKEFKKIVANLEICSRRKANYSEVIDRSMKQLKDYVAVREENKRMVGNARKTILMMIGIGILCFYMLNDFKEEGIFRFMQQSVVGQVILFYLFFTILYSLWKMLSMGQKE